MKIVDEQMAPYYIEKSNDGGYTVKKAMGKLDKNNEEVVKIYGYFSTIPGALKKVAESLLEDKYKGSLVFLRDYIDEYKCITENIY